MARVNIEESAFGDRRLGRLANRLGWSVPQALGHLVMLWHESQEHVATHGTSAEIAAWGWADSDEAQAAAFVKALSVTGYIRESADPGQWEIRGNEAQLRGIASRSGRGKKGGKATAAKWAELREREGLEPTPSRLVLGVLPTNARQCKAKQSIALLSDDAAADAATPAVDLVAIWNTHRGEHLPAATGTKQQRAKAAVRLKDQPTADYWVAIVKRLAASSFACGLTGGTWRADFNWLVKNGENPDKVNAGNFDDRKPRAAEQPAIASRRVDDIEQLRREVDGK